MPSENVRASESGVPAGGRSGDRRTRKRAARREHLLELAADLVAQVGVDGVTMAALAEAADYAPASLYTYFPSRSALLAALQERALTTLGDVAEAELRAWDERVATGSRGEGEAPVALARLLLFSELFLAAPRRHPREFRLQQELLVSADAEETVDAASVLPAAMRVLELPRRLLAAAVAAGALDAAEVVRDPIGEPVDGDLARTFGWLLALNGVLLVDGLVIGAPATGVALGRQLTDSLLRGWGADPAALDAARSLTGDQPTGEVPS